MASWLTVPMNSQKPLKLNYFYVMFFQDDLQKMSHSLSECKIAFDGLLSLNETDIQGNLIPD